MKISDITAYFINPDDYKHRLPKISSTLNSMPFKSINRIAFNEKLHGKNNTMTKAHITLINRAIEENSFPFAIFEDDAKLIKDLPEEFNLPEEVELLYLGGSNYNCGGEKPSLYIENYNDDFYRVYYMLSAHAIIVPSIIGANVILTAYERALSKSGYNDIELALDSKNHLFVVPKEGNYFYQDDYTTSVTNFLWKDMLHLIR